MLVKQIYELLEQAELVDTLEEYSTQWLNKHKTTASYLIHKNRDLSISNKVNCLNSVIKKLLYLKKDEVFFEFNSKKIKNLELIKSLLITDLFEDKLNWAEDD